MCTKNSNIFKRNIFVKPFSGEMLRVIFRLNMNIITKKSHFDGNHVQLHLTWNVGSIFCYFTKILPFERKPVWIWSIWRKSRVIDKKYHFTIKNKFKWCYFIHMMQRGRSGRCENSGAEVSFDRGRSVFC